MRYSCSGPSEPCGPAACAAGGNAAASDAPWDFVGDLGVAAPATGSGDMGRERTAERGGHAGARPAWTLRSHRAALPSRGSDTDPGAGACASGADSSLAFALAEEGSSTSAVVGEAASHLCAGACAGKARISLASQPNGGGSSLCREGRGQELFSHAANFTIGEKFATSSTLGDPFMTQVREQSFARSNQLRFKEQSFALPCPLVMFI